MEATLSRMHRLERGGLIAALSLLTLLSWWSMVHPMQGGPAGEMIEAIAMSTMMWAVMMVAMMLPSASPMVLTYWRIYQARSGKGMATVPSWLFTAGYLLVWTGFSVVLATGQWTLYESGVLTSAMGHVDPSLGGGLLVLAGLFQFSALKQTCLDKCRSPMGFMMTEWREGIAGTLVMGIRLGSYCTGCCWALMLLMFVGGVMSLVWMAALAMFFLAEKLLSQALARWLRPISGALLIVAGAAIMAGGVMA